SPRQMASDVHAERPSARGLRVRHADASARRGTGAIARVGTRRVDGALVASSFEFESALLGPGDPSSLILHFSRRDAQGTMLLDTGSTRARNATTAATC